MKNMLFSRISQESTAVSVTVALLVLGKNLMCTDSHKDVYYQNNVKATIN